MREDDSSWFSKWEDELPSPDELMPLSQTLITPDLASAFDIRGPGGGAGGGVVAPTTLFHHHHHNYGGQLQQQQQQQQQSSSAAAAQAAPTHPNSSEFDSSSAELGGGGGGGGGGGVGSELGEPARTLKRPRLVWTPQLHKRFVDAVAHLGIKNAVPKTIMQLMSVDGLTRENVASHLQKYRLYLKRMQGGGGGISGGGGNGPGGLGGTGDAATDRLFASSPVPAHFLHQPAGGVAGGAGAGVGNGHGHGPVAGPRPNADHFMSYVPVAALHQQQIQAQYRQMGHFGAAPGGGGGGGGAQFDHPFLSRQAQLCPNRNGVVMQNSSGFVEDVESSAVANSGRKVLTLFPTADD